jgi:hypothetical protein
MFYMVHLCTTKHPEVNIFFDPRDNGMCIDVKNSFYYEVEYCPFCGKSKKAIISPHITLDDGEQAA